jgi:hypothetical protein
MRMSVTVKGRPLARQIQIPREDWHRIGNELRTRIITRTRLKNVDADGVPFAAYSEGYAKAKAKAGGVATRVNLTGVRAGARMLDNIAVTANAVTNPRILLNFALERKAEIARYHMGEGRVDRRFFALSDEDESYLHAAVRAALNRA